MADSAEQEAPRFRPISLIPGNVIVECAACRRRLSGVTAADALGLFEAHVQVAHTDRGSKGHD